MPPAQTITSAANPLVKDVRRAIARGGLTAGGLCIAETFHLLEEALRSDCPVQAVLACRNPPGPGPKPAWKAAVNGLLSCRMRCFRASPGRKPPQGVIALVRPRHWSLEQLFRGLPLVVVLDGVQDPGNAGAIVRAAEAFGATGCCF